MWNFYKCEIIGSISNEIFTCYLAEKDIEENNDKTFSILKAENKAIQYFDNELSRTFGDLESISIVIISAEEYYGAKKSISAIFI